MVESTSYPKVSSNAWRALRARAAAAPSTKLTPASVAAILHMSSPKSAADNVVYPMRRLGLIDEEGSLTERGQKWRVDGTYATACDEIIDEIYPAELSSLTDDEGKPDKARVKTWLQHKGLGDSNASNMASTYVMIAERQVPEAPTTNGQAKPRPKVAPAPSTKVSPNRSTAASERLPAAESTGNREPVAPIQSTANGPEVRLDIQIHIPATATADQIDQIFASMAKHLYKS